MTYKPKYGFYLTMGPDPKGRGTIVVCSDGTTQLGHEGSKVMATEFVKDYTDGLAWYQRVCLEQPWNKRN